MLCLTLKRGRRGGTRPPHSPRGGSTIATLTAIESRAVLALLLLSGAIVLMLAALVERPEGNHGHSEAAALATEHDADEQPTVEATEAIDEHGGTSAGTPEAANAAESDHGETGNVEPDHASEEQRSDSVWGIDAGSLNLVSPRLTLVVIALTVLLAAALAIRRSVWLLWATVGLGLAGVAVGVHEASHAGEELGIFVPLPILASVLYAGAAGLAGLALIAPRAEPPAARHE
jgi:hypothetical protein